MQASHLLHGALAGPSRRFATRAPTAYNHFVKEAFQMPQVAALPGRERIPAVAYMWNKLPDVKRLEWENYAKAHKGTKHPASPAHSKAQQVKPIKQREAAITPKEKRAKKAERRRGSQAPKGPPSERRGSPKEGGPAWPGGGRRAGRKESSAQAIQRLEAEVKALKAKVQELTLAMGRKPSGYQCYVASASKYPEVQVLPVEKRLGTIAQLWRQLTEEQKKPFVEEAATKAGPEKAPSAYHLFMKEAFRKPEVQRLPMEQKLREVARQWKALAEEQKRAFGDEAAKRRPPPSQRLSGYNLFVREAFAKAEITALPFKDRLREIGKQWRGLSANQKAAYGERASSAPPGKAAPIPQPPSAPPAAPSPVSSPPTQRDSAEGSAAAAASTRPADPLQDKPSATPTPAPTSAPPPTPQQSQGHEVGRAEAPPSSSPSAAEAAAAPAAGALQVSGDAREPTGEADSPLEPTQRPGTSVGTAAAPGLQDPHMGSP